MKKITTSLFFYLIFVTLKAQTPLPYFTGFDTPAQQADWVEYRKGSTISTTWGVFSQNFYSGPNSLQHFYPAGEQTDDWYVSPPFHFPSGAHIDSLRFSFTGFSTSPTVNDTIAIYALSGSADPASATKTLLLDFRGQNYVSDGLWRDTSNIFIPASTTPTTFIAIRYKGSNSWLDVRFDNLSISGIVPTASFSISNATPCEGDAVMYTDESTAGPTVWNWSFPGGSPSTSSVQNPTVNYASAGTYTASLVCNNSMGPSNTYTHKVEVNTCTGINDQSQLLENVLVFPNPTKNKFFLSSSHKEAMSYAVYNSIGEKIVEGKIQKDQMEIVNLEMQVKGIYFIKIKYPEGTRSTKILKE